MGNSDPMGLGFAGLVSGADQGVEALLAKREVERQRKLAEEVAAAGVRHKLEQDAAENQLKIKNLDISERHAAVAERDADARERAQQRLEDKEKRLSGLEQDKLRELRGLAQIIQDPTQSKERRRGAMLQAEMIDPRGVFKDFFPELMASTDEAVYNVDPAKGKIQQIGTVPKGSHILPQPQPKQTSTGNDDPNDATNWTWQPGIDDNGKQIWVRANRVTGQLIPANAPTAPGGAPGGVQRGTTAPKLSAGAQKEQAAGDLALENLSFLLEKFPGVEDRVGPAAGRWTNIKQNMPLTKADPQFAEFAAQSATLRNNLMRAMVGLTQTPQEAERMIEELPTVTDKNWQVKADLTKKNLELLQVRRRAAAKPLAAQDNNDAGAGGDAYAAYLARTKRK